MNDNRFVEIFQLTKAYPNRFGESVPAIEGFDLKIARGERIAIIGHSGCGKSTVLTMVAGLNSITSGGVVVDGREIGGPGPERAVVFQSPSLLPWMTALQNVLLGVDNVYPHATRKQRRELAEHYLALVGLADSLGKYPRELSNGMRQRVGIARAIALQPKVLLLDEPFGMLDSLTRIELQRILLDVLAETRATAILVTHDVDEALLVADRVVMMTTGPRARIGELVDVPFGPVRVREQVLTDPRYYPLRGRLIDFLEAEDARREGPSQQPAAAEPSLVGESPEDSFALPSSESDSYYAPEPSATDDAVLASR
ncbi:MAG TPA: ABC transporter ATP-binding protein [Pirellulaceae bacterium]|jgi:nitrate ABC transporter ATP-binding subunit|nr:ABC transporter ATP-binding protein [Pirellulaceae bacterium]